MLSFFLLQILNSQLLPTLVGVSSKLIFKKFCASDLKSSLNVFLFCLHAAMMCGGIWRQSSGAILPEIPY
jgi:hypothetical protein